MKLFNIIFLCNAVLAGHLAAMENTALEAPLPVQEFSYHLCIPSLLHLTLATMSREQLDTMLHERPDDTLASSAWKYGVLYKKYPCRTNPVEMLKSSLGHKKITKEEFIQKARDSLEDLFRLVPGKQRCFEHLVTHAHLTQDMLNELLLEADASCNLPAINLLRHHHAKGEFFDRWKAFPLHDAVVLGDKEKVKALATKDTVNEHTNHTLNRMGTLNRTRTPLQLAAAYDQADIINSLLPYASYVNKDSSLAVAISYGAEKVIEPLIKGGANINVASILTDDRTPSMLACICSNTSALRSLLAHGADIFQKNDDGKTALHLSVMLGNVNATKLLIQHITEKSAKSNLGENLLHEMIATKDRFDSTPLRSAFLNGDFDTIDILVSCGADLHEIDTNNKTLLHAVAETGNSDTDMAEYLIDHHLDINAEDNYGDTPLNTAIKSGSPAMIVFLINHDADIHKKNSQAQTPLHLAAASIRSTDLAEFLIGKGLDVNAKDKDGNTPLHLCRDRETAICLVRRGARLKVKNNRRETPLDCARRNKEDELVSLFLPSKNSCCSIQ